MNTIILAVAGVVIGLFVISTGGGGAAFYLGILTGVFKLAPATAAATSIITALPSIIIGSWGYYRQHLINFRIGNLMLISAVPAVIVGALISPYIPETIYRWIIGIILVLLGVRIFLQRGSSRKPQHGKMLAILYGIMSGLMVGVAGLSGGGPIMAGALILGLDTFHATATSSYVLVGMCFLGAILHLTNGSVDWAAGLPLMLGAIVGATMAPLLVKRISQSKHNGWVQPLIAVLLIFMGINTIR
ncbi:sulfite exporter TauE/SafE family protein [Secundilactobacillus folii]|uniref:Probable membrane transporter protein n=1 Tax=Secundilactobacillus folii TaxID=2678357 RepID=A0A7X2XUP6_9LACO|nr:TSUP family transporter [Secundilactobacillus folii]